MKSRKKGSDQESERQKRARERIWEQPELIEEIFNDGEWQKYDGKSLKDVPSDRMAKNVKDGVAGEKLRLHRREIRLRRANQMLQAGIAASLLVMFSFVFWYKSADEESPALVQQDTLPEQPQWVVLFNESESVDTVRLPDRSVVHLYAHSSIRYEEGFAKDSREIFLEGKAFFDVKKDPSRPFGVIAGDTKTVALGTSFTIDFHRDKHLTSVFLHTGKVVVSLTTEDAVFENVLLDRAGGQLVLDADMRIVRHDRGRPKNDRPVLAKASVQAEKNLLHIDNKPLQEVFVSLQNVYGATITVDDDRINNILYTGMIDTQRESIQDVLTVICLISDLRYEVDDDGVYKIIRNK